MRRPHTARLSPTSLIPRLPLQVGHEGAVVKLEKMSVLRQQLHRQLAQLKRTYMPQETAPKKGWFGRDERTFTALPLGGRSLDDDDTLEQRELLALYVT